MKKKIVVMDKDEELLDVIGFILDQEGFHIKKANNLEELYEQMLDFEPDAILLDVITPFTGEAEFCRSLKASPKTCDIPVVVLSTSIQVTEAMQVICANAAVAKPFDIHHLVDTVKVIVAQV